MRVTLEALKPRKKQNHPKRMEGSEVDRKKWRAKAILLRKRHPWYYSYSAARQRCTNKNNPRYYTYGARGIKFLMTPEDFKFLWFRDKAYLMKKPTIDREDINGNYEINNCRFIEHRENLILYNRMKHLKTWKLI